MSPKLKPLLLPQLVEERRKADGHTSLPDEDQTVVYLAENTSSSDLTSPLTPTFSHRGGHLRYSSSVSSIDIAPLSVADSPASPTQLPSQTKRPLADVAEEDFWEKAREIAEQNNTAPWCLCTGAICQCQAPNTAMESEASSGALILSESSAHFDWDGESLSDGDFSVATRSRSRSQRKRVGSADASFSGLTSRFGTRMSSLSRWRSTSRRVNSAFTAASDPTLDHPMPSSLPPSSRSSSISAPSRHAYERMYEPPLPPTPALSFYNSTDSLAIQVPLEMEPAEAGRDLERERSMATTPLLPPLLAQASCMSQPQSTQPSPLQSPTIAPLSDSPDTATPSNFSSPPLSSKPSFSSFRPLGISTFSPPISAAASELPSPIPNLNLLEQNDDWADRLGHANFTIAPKPYTPSEIEVDCLRQLRADWDQARVNYTKHLVRTGEHYGTTSKTYSLTEAKWAETEQEWKTAHETILSRLAAAGTTEDLTWHRVDHDVPATIPRMLDTEGKFPNLGDEDIVGPMLRDTVMIRDDLSSDGKARSSRFWKSLVGKVGLKK